MSLDADYIFVYELKDTDLIRADREYLKLKYAAYDNDFVEIDYGRSVFWQKPKYTLTEEDYVLLHADQILEREDCEFWDIVKYPDDNLDNFNDGPSLEKKLGMALEKIATLQRDLDIWKSAYKKNVRPKSNMMDQQNSIISEENDD